MRVEGIFCSTLISKATFYNYKKLGLFTGIITRKISAGKQHYMDWDNLIIKRIQEILMLKHSGCSLDELVYKYTGKPLKTAKTNSVLSRFENPDKQIDRLTAENEKLRAKNFELARAGRVKVIEWEDGIEMICIKKPQEEL